MLAHNHNRPAQKLDGQTQIGLLLMPQTPPTDKRTTTTDSSTLNSEQSKRLSTNETAADRSADSTIPDIRVNRSRQVPPSLRLPKEGSLAALLIGDSNLRHVDSRATGQTLLHRFQFTAIPLVRLYNIGYTGLSWQSRRLSDFIS